MYEPMSGRSGGDVSPGSAGSTNSSKSSYSTCSSSSSEKDEGSEGESAAEELRKLGLYLKNGNEDNSNAHLKQQPTRSRLARRGAATKSQLNKQVSNQLQLLEDLSSLLKRDKPRGAAHFQKERKARRGSQVWSSEAFEKLVENEQRLVSSPVQRKSVMGQLERRRRSVLRLELEARASQELEGHEDDICPFKAISDGNLVEVRTWVLVRGESSRTLNSVNPATGRTLLQEASVHGRIEIIRFLLEYFCITTNINRLSLLGRNTALHFASANGHNAVARALVNAGADINVRNKLGEQPIHLASQPAVALSLLAKGADSASLTKNGLQPAQCAAMRGNQEVYDVFQNHNIKLQRDKDKARALIEAKRKANEIEIEARRKILDEADRKEKLAREYMRWRTGKK